MSRDKAVTMLKTSKGQIEGVLKMIEDDRYCIDISKQILSIQAQLKKANLEILKNHMSHCVKDAFEGDNQEQKEEKIEEIMMILDRYYK